MNALTGPFPAFPDQTDVIVIMPNGAAVSEADYGSHRYHHHAKVAPHKGRIWTAYSSGGTNEDGGGQKTMVSWANNVETLVFSASILALDSQSPWGNAKATLEIGTYITYPRHFVKTGGKLYLVVAVDKVDTGQLLEGIGLFAVECMDDGTLSAPFRVSVADYTPFSGFTKIDYDADRAPAIYAIAKLYGKYGGSHPDVASQSDWTNWWRFQFVFSSPTTIPLDATGTRLLQLWRKQGTGAGTGFVYSRMSPDGGVTWSYCAGLTQIPDAPSTTEGIRIPETNRIVLTGNPQDQVGGNSRDPLYVAFYDGRMIDTPVVYAVSSGLPDDPVYAGSEKAGSASYPCVCQDGEDLFVIFSNAKESIRLSRLRKGALL